MNEAATTIPQTSDGAVGRSNNDRTRAGIARGPSPLSEVPRAEVAPGIHPGSGDRFCVITQTHIDLGGLARGSPCSITGVAIATAPPRHPTSTDRLGDIDGSEVISAYECRYGCLPSAVAQ